MKLKCLGSGSSGNCYLLTADNGETLLLDICMNADDDGFVNNTRKIIRMCGASEDDLKSLIDNRFLLSFDSGVMLVKHWRIHNYIPPDRYKPCDADGTH